MAIPLLSVVARHERRVRLVFAGALAAGAFTSTSYYAIACTNARGGDPTVSAAVAVSGDGSVVDLALGLDLVEGGTYTVTCTSVPGADASTFSGSQTFFFGTAAPRASVEPETRDLDALLFGVDLVWTGLDYLETADGDLATLEGLPNAQSAIQRRVYGSPLPWAPDYSARLDEYVDAPAVTAETARGRILTQVRRDDRVKTADVTVRTDEDAPADVYFDVDVVLIGNRRPGPFTRSVRG